jgi:hypothetical protein
MNNRCLGKPSLPEVTIDKTVTTTTTTTTIDTNRKWTIKSSDLKTNKSPLNMNLWKIISQNNRKEKENLKNPYISCGTYNHSELNKGGTSENNEREYEETEKNDDKNGNDGNKKQDIGNDGNKKQDIGSDGNKKQDIGNDENEVQDSDNENEDEDEDENEENEENFDHREINSSDPAIMILLEKMSAIEKELKELRNQSNITMNNNTTNNNTTNNIINNNNNLIINVVFQPKNSTGSDNAIDIFECLRLKGWCTSQIYAYAMSLVSQPKDKLRWTLNELIIDLARMKYPLDYKDKKLWIQLSPFGDMVETNTRKIDRINNEILKNFVSKAHNAMIEEHLSSSEQLFLPYENEKDHYSTDEEEKSVDIKTKAQVIKVRTREDEEQLEMKRRKIARDRDIRNDKLLCYGLYSDPKNHNILDQLMKFNKIELRKKYIEDVIDEVKQKKSQLINSQ